MKAARLPSSSQKTEVLSWDSGEVRTLRPWLLGIVSHFMEPFWRTGMAAVRNARIKYMTAVHSGKTGRKLETANLNGCFARSLPDMSAFLSEICKSIWKAFYKGCEHRPPSSNVQCFIN